MFKDMSRIKSVSKHLLVFFSILRYLRLFERPSDFVTLAFFLFLNFAVSAIFAILLSNDFAVLNKIHVTFANFDKSVAF